MRRKLNLSATSETDSEIDSITDSSSDIDWEEISLHCIYVRYMKQFWILLHIQLKAYWNMCCVCDVDISCVCGGEHLLICSPFKRRRICRLIEKKSKIAMHVMLFPTMNFGAESLYDISV